MMNNAVFHGKSLKSRIFSVINVAVMTVAFVAASFPVTDIPVYAGEDKTISGLCTGAIANPTYGDTAGLTQWTGNYVYYGNYNNAAMKYRVLDTAATEFNANTTMLLDCDSTLLNMAHGPNPIPSGYRYNWGISNIMTWLNGENFYGNTNVFTAQENAAIAYSTKDFPAEGDDGGGWAGNLGYNDLFGEHVFLLDAVEATRLSYGYADQATAHNTRIKNGTATWWWLRSPHSYDGRNAGRVTATGGIDYNYVDNYYGVSPALNLNLESVIFSSLIPNMTNEYKLTVKDTNMTIAKTDGFDITRDGNVVTVPYTITGGTPTQVSVLITDEEYSAGIVPTSGYSYQKLNVTTWDTSGTGTFTLPDEYADQTCGTDYFAYILAEDVNGTYETDYASAPAGITIPDKPVLTITAKDKTYTYNGEMQGPGYTTYEDPDEIAEMVTVEGLQSGDTLTSIIVAGREKEVGDYRLSPSSAQVNNSDASDKYDVVYVDGTLHITSPEKSYIVTFKVKNGAWNDGTKAEKTVTLFGNAGDALKLSADQIPAVGSKPDTHYKEGKWDATPDTKTVIASDMTYTYTYANDEPQPGNYTITFDPNAKDASGKMDPQQIEKGKEGKLNANKYTREDFTFDGWNTKKDGSGTKYADKASFTPKEDTTLYAQWKEVKKYAVTVTADPANGGTVKSSVSSGKSGTKVTLTATAGKDFLFKEWKVVAGGVELANKTSASTTFKIGSANVEVKATFANKKTPISEKTSIKNAKVKLSKTSLKYTGKAQKPAVKSVTLNGKTLDAKNDYTVSWSNSKSKKLGTYKVTITGKGKYKGSKTVNYKIVQGDNPLTVKLKKNKLNVPLSKLKKGNQTIKLSKYLKVSKGQGKITYKRTKGDKKISIDNKTGNITVKNSLKAGTYNVTISVKAAGNKNYKAATKKVKVKIVVK